ncbi:MAG: helix-turn-helix domain-containing protein [Oligoflexia bacterium]|nr:helix-turn-helix domain-containing protein [Oligoflexia bacterium]
MFDLNDGKFNYSAANVSSLVMPSLKRRLEESRANRNRIPQALKLQIVQATTKMSCGQVAEQLGLSKSTISRWRNGIADRSIKESAGVKFQRERSCAISAIVAEPKNSVATRATTLQRWSATIFTMLLVIVTTLLLVAEARLFYARDSNASLALAKAIILEVSVLYLSFSKANSFTEQVIKTVMLTVLVMYSAYTVSGHLLASAGQSKALERSLVSEMELLKQELATKEQKIQTYLEMDRMSTASKLEREKSELLARLSKRQDQQRVIVPSLIGEGNLYSLVMFRIILLVMNVLLTHRLRDLHLGGLRLSSVDHNLLLQKQVIRPLLV